MMKKSIGYLLLLFWLAVAAQVSAASLDELAPERVGRWPGGIAERVSKERWPKAQFLYPDSISDLVQLLRQGKIDVFILQKAFVDSLRQAYDKDPQTLGIRGFNDHVSADHRVEKVMLPMRDGLTLIRKK